MTDNLGGGGGVLRAVVTITRKATGETEEYVLTGHVKAEAEAEASAASTAGQEGPK